jgi:capsular polysaccharide biosynthesis protein
VRAAYENAVINDARGTQEVSLVDSASAPVYPDRPLRHLFALIGLLCGLIGGTGVAFFIDHISGLRTGESVASPAGYPRPASGQTALPVFGSQTLERT